MLRAAEQLDVLVKVDVGFHRCGVDPLSDAALALVRKVAGLPGLRLRGLLSHAGHAYHATLPTDALAGLRDAMLETRAMGFDAAKAAQFSLGKGARALLAAYGHKPLAAEGFGAPGVVVCFTDRPDLQNGSAFAAAGYQIAAGVPLMVGEGAEFRTFRIGLFGLDKLKDVPGTLSRLDAALKAVSADTP